MTALLLAALLVAAPIQPVGYAWTLAPEPPPPYNAPPYWTPWRLDTLAVTLRSTEASAPTLRISYQRADAPGMGWVSWSAPLYAPFGPNETRTLTFWVPWIGVAPGPVLLAVWSDCGDGRQHYQGGFIPRPGQTLPPYAAAMPFSQLAQGAFCPPITLPNGIFSDGFETGGLRRWVVAKDAEI